MAPQQIGHHRRAAPVGHTAELDARLLLHQLERDMRHRSDARVPDVELAGVGLGMVEQGLEAFDRRIHAGDHGDR